ncbi:hypothetical protein IWQ60_010179 [Tieghemiomyces parasiticus]|uniref:Importin subunit alpha n=1 Tax=Tieghemiomyces parasiticus TaxID=78921 RepID=A0A9W7ZR23_9FUNG|nr:hypothetical protein IWQ60_010179 [Tieghemiomyces parasiticus]
MSDQGNPDPTTMATDPTPSTTGPSARRRSLFKANGVPRSPREARASRIALDARERKRKREQLIMGKRFRSHFEDYEESDSEAEHEATPTEIQEINRGLAGSDEQVAKALKLLSARLVSPSAALEKFILAGECVPHLMRLIHSPNPEIQLQATWCLTNIAAGSEALCHKVLDAVPYLIQSLNPLNPDLADQAGWCLGNIAAEGPAFREHLVANGVVTPLVDLLTTSPNSQLTQTACFALSNLARNPGAPMQQLFDAGICGRLVKHLSQHESQDVASEVFWVLTYLTAGELQYAHRLVEQDVIPHLVAQLDKFADQGSAAIPLIRTLGNLSAIDDATTSRLLDHPEIIQQLLYWVAKSPARTVKKESLWVLSNITAGTKAHVNKVLKQDGAAVLTEVMSHDSYDLRREVSLGKREKLTGKMIRWVL